MMTAALVWAGLFITVVVIAGNGRLPGNASGDRALPLCQGRNNASGRRHRRRRR